MRSNSFAESTKKPFLNSLFDLNLLTTFNPATVYCLDPESSLIYRDYNTTECLLHIIGQYQDIFNAYLYAQEVILPTIATIGITNITADHLLEWLDQIHLRITQTMVNDYLSADMRDVAGGECTKRQIIRWHHGTSTSGLFGLFITGKLNDNQAMNIIKENNIDEKTAKAFASLLLKIYILTKLKSLTGLENWTAYQQPTGLFVLLELRDRELALRIVTSLKNTGALKAELKKNRATKIPVICLTEIHPEKLNNIAALGNFTPPQWDQTSISTNTV